MKWGVFFTLVMVALLALPTMAWADAVCPCPENTTSVVKCEWNEATSTYDCTEGDVDAVTFGDGTDADGGTWTSTVEIKTVVVKGATSCYTYNYNPAVTSGSFSNEVLEPNPNGKPPDISHVEFCKPKPTAVGLKEFNVRCLLKLPWYLELLQRL